jgi:L,D-peptidoglycan transpeptidase YkuD (ErfK/YbiS/YcfS/YnhG family)
VARRGKRRLGRLLVRVTALGLAAAVVGLSSSASIAGTPALAGDATALRMPAPVTDLTRLRAELPPGYGTVADTQAREAAAAQAAATAAAAQAAAAQAAAAAAAAAAPTSTPTSSSRTPTRPAAPPAGAVLPLGVDPGRATQVVTVVASSSRATTAKLTAWELGPGGWTAVLGPVTARIGSGGVGQASETSTRTPAGVFSLTEAFGRQGDPGTGLPYRVVDGQDWWVSDVASPLYNQHARCAPGTCPFDETVSENLQAAGAVYDYAVVIDYNRGGTPGAGSAFFLHVTNGVPTAGCVAIDRGSLVTLMRWLDPGSRPLIAIGVG